VYGQEDPEYTYHLAGDSIVGGDDISGRLSRAGGQNVGSYAYTLGNLAISPNYVLTLVPGATFDITRAMLTVKALNASGISGNPLPSFAGVITGFANGDNDSVISGLTYTSPATSASPAGTYSINPGGASALNYSFTYQSGVLTLSSADVPPTPPEPPVEPPVIPPVEPPVVAPPSTPGLPSLTLGDLAAFNATWGRNNQPQRHFTRRGPASGRTRINYADAAPAPGGTYHMSSYNLFGNNNEISINATGNGR
jgi:hypothetical protein